MQKDFEAFIMKLFSHTSYYEQKKMDKPEIFWPLMIQFDENISVQLKKLLYVVLTLPLRLVNYIMFITVYYLLLNGYYLFNIALPPLNVASAY
jgi:hypothetical protein